MITYIYPQNLKATANLWFWSMRDFTILSVAALIAAILLVQTKMLFPIVATLSYAFLTIRIDETTVLDFIKYGIRYFITTQQYFEWKAR